MCICTFELDKLKNGWALFYEWSYLYFVLVNIYLTDFHDKSVDLNEIQTDLNNSLH